MEGQLSDALSTTLAQKITDGTSRNPPSLTRRDIRLPQVPGKALAVIGMRRAGKTYFLWQCLADRIAAGAPRETQLYFNFEDERLAGIQAIHLQNIVETYYRLYPQFRDTRRVTFYLDEIQTVPGWETFVRRLLDDEKIDIFLSGSSARLLSREVATSMRGRALEVLVHPFSFRETLRHHHDEPLPEKTWDSLPKARRSAIDAHLRAYLSAGGFPETQGVATRDRAALLRSYADVALLRDIIERHSITNPAALRWLLRHLLGNAAAPFSAQKFYDALRSQGLPVAKDTVHEYLAHLEDAFLIRTTSLHTASERQRMVNPRKAYPIDPGFIPLYERAQRANLGHALETAVLIELERRGCEATYVKTPAGFEIDFRAQPPTGPAQLIQVCADLTAPETHERETRALLDAAKTHPRAGLRLLTLDSTPPAQTLPQRIHWQSAASWFLDGVL